MEFFWDFFVRAVTVQNVRGCLGLCVGNLALNACLM